MKKLIGFFVMSLMLTVTITGFLLGGVKVAKAQIGPFVCPVADIALTRCSGDKDCLYPNPDNCASFIYCKVDANGITGTPALQDCPADLEWNDNKKICDWPNNSTCGQNVNTVLDEVEGNKVKNTLGGL